MKNPNDDIRESDGCLSNEIGTKGRFSILTNPKGEVLLVTDAREGEPDDPRFIYDGGDAALLFRSFESNVAIRGLDENACEPLKNVNVIQIIEVSGDDVVRKYVAPVRMVKNVKGLML